MSGNLHARVRADARGRGGGRALNYWSQVTCAQIKVQIGGRGRTRTRRLIGGIQPLMTVTTRLILHILYARLVDFRRGGVGVDVAVGLVVAPAHAGGERDAGDHVAALE